ncbi:MAG: hypothetical protein HKL95_02330 [Phycisphaerae bacterium]|nr:hypothetical protein [Phycisphaerae bacterium]
MSRNRLRSIIATALALLMTIGARLPSLAAKTPATELVRLAAPHLSAAKNGFSIPAAFWNEHLTNWLDVAICGRPSNFLHETILSIQTTRTIIRHAMKTIGFRNADDWAPDFRDFVQVRGQPLLILVRFRQGGKMRTFPLEELISLEQWNISIGPIGWIYLGTPEAHASALHAQAYQPGQWANPNAILVDDPQVAMQFRGIQSSSQALVDNPLCFDGWIYPNIRYFRNTSPIPWKVYNSNGAVHATLIFRHVSEVQYLQQCARYWHDAAFAKYILAQLPVARKIDRFRKELWQLTHVQHKIWRSSPTVQYAAANLQADYAALDAAWISWDFHHARFGPGSPATLAAIKVRASLFHQYMNQRKERWAQWLIAAGAVRELALLRKTSPQPLAPATLARLQARELAARSRAMLLKNAQTLQMWTQKLKSLSPTDPRKQWIKDVHAEFHLARARQQLGNAGIAYAHAMRLHSPKQLTAAQKQYLLAILRTTLDRAIVRLVNIEFEISSQRGFASKTHMNRLQAAKAVLLREIKTIRSHISQVHR